MLFLFIPVIFFAVILTFKTEKLKKYFNVVSMYFIYYTVFNLVWFFCFKSYALPNEWGVIYIALIVLIFNTILDIYLCLYSYLEENNMIITNIILLVLNSLFMFQYSYSFSETIYGRIKITSVASGWLLLVSIISSILFPILTKKITKQSNN